MLRHSKRLLRYLLVAVVGLAAVVIVYLGATMAGALLAADGAPNEKAGPPERVYLLTSLLHADFAIPADESLRQRFAFLRDAGVPLDHPDLRYLVFGWGARGFYLQTRTLADIRPIPTMKAIFGDSSVMHVVAAKDVSGAPGAVPIDLPPGGLERLIAFIEASFERGAEGPRVIPGAAYGDSDAFFDGVGRFNIFRPCNIWVAEALQAAGLSTGAWTPTTFSLLYGLRLHGGAAIGG
jgi:uncharacterized protein (TIGR02117 family)